MFRIQVKFYTFKIYTSLIWYIKLFMQYRFDMIVIINKYFKNGINLYPGIQGFGKWKFEG